MLTAITWKDFQTYENSLHELFNLRYRVFIERWGWDLELDHIGLDIDEFDNKRTLYLICTSDSGQVRAGVRFNPSLFPHLLSDLFPEACKIRGVPRAKDTYESSRLVIDEIGLDRRAYNAVRKEIYYGVVKLCRHVGIAKLSWQCPLASYRYFIRHLPSTPLGLPIKYPDGRCYAAAVSMMDDRVLSFCQNILKIPEPRLQISTQSSQVIDDIRAGILEERGSSYAYKRL